MKFKLDRIIAFAATGLACIVVSLIVPVSAQEVEAESASIGATINSEAIPEDAKTIEDPAIEIDDLELLLKPFTLEELENEAAAWLLLLKNKVQEMSNTEIVIKRENRKVDSQQKSIKLLEKADQQLKDAEKAQAEAAPDTPEYQEALDKLEEAKETLEKAEVFIEKEAEASTNLKEDKALQEALARGKQEQIIKQAQEIAKKANNIRQEIPSDSSLYKAVTEKIDSLEKSINSLEKTEEDLKSNVTDSAEYQEAANKITQDLEAVKNATAELTKLMPELVDQTSSLTGTKSEIQNEEQLKQAASVIENAEEQIDLDNVDNSTIRAVEKQLEKLTEKFENKTQQETELKNQLVVNATNLQSEQTAIIDRFNVVLDALDNKGGDPSSYRTYIEAASGIEIDFTDTEGLGVRLISWVMSPDGGLTFLLGLAKFGGILLVSVVLAPQMGRIANRLLERVSVLSSLLREFIVIIIKRGVIVVGCLLGLASIGVNLGPILALAGGASFVLAFALQSNLGNFASGLMLLFNKPFDIGDEVKIGETWAWIDKITLANTKLKGWHGEEITIPNNTVWSSQISNLTAKENRRGGFSLCFPFDEDISAACRILKDVASKNSLVLETPAPSTFVWEPNEYGVFTSFTFSTKTPDFWTVSEEILCEFLAKFKEQGIRLAVPTQDIRSIPESLMSEGNGNVKKVGIISDV